MRCDNISPFLSNVPLTPPRARTLLHRGRDLHLVAILLLGVGAVKGENHLERAFCAALGPIRLCFSQRMEAIVLASRMVPLSTQLTAWLIGRNRSCITSSSSGCALPCLRPRAK